MMVICLVAFELAFWPEADEALSRLEADAAWADVLDAVNRTLDRLERDPFDPRLGTTVFTSDEYANIGATPVRVGDWYVFWQRGERARTIEIVLIHELSTGLER
jgi:hypothetical protein